MLDEGKQKYFPIFKYVCKTLILVGSNPFQAKTVTYSKLLVLVKSRLSKTNYCIAINCKNLQKERGIQNWLNTGNKSVGVPAKINTEWLGAKETATSRPTSESSSKELNLGSKLNQTWNRPDLDLTSPEFDSKSLSILSSSGPGPGPRSGPGQVPGQVQKVQGLRTQDMDLG